MSINCSAVIRLKDEAEFLPYCLESIINAFDEIILCTQGEQSDNTIEICKEWQSLHDHVSYYHYELDSHPNGEGHSLISTDDPRSRAYFYNWCFDKAKGKYKCKWDGDMVAHDNLTDALSIVFEGGYDVGVFKGVDLVGDYWHTGERVYCASEPRIFKSGHYVTGRMCEQFVNDGGGNRFDFPYPLFVHMKWLKPEKSITKAWPENWRETSEHFQEIWKRRTPTKKYYGELPSCLKT